MTSRAPALFVGHGSPMNAIEDTPSTRGWVEVAQRFPKPRAIVCISAHWVTDGVRVTSNAHPRTIHDFGRSFPQALFEVQYPAEGDPDLAGRIVVALQHLQAQLDDTWGLDHGAWSVLRHMYPQADVPTVQVSLDMHAGPDIHLEIARVLGEFRQSNILVIGSGNIVHNLPAFFAGNGNLLEWEIGFDATIETTLRASNEKQITDYRSLPDAALAAPDWEHFHPVMYGFGARLPNETPYFFNRHYHPGISMTAFAYGLPQ